MTDAATSPAPCRIAIIGGGVSGAALLLALLRQDRAAEVVVYEPEAELGPGLAYGAAAAPWHLLNVVATRASLYANDPDHWWRWARQHGPALGWADMAQVGAKDYLPRRLFGHYVVHELNAARQRPGLVRVLHYRAAATDMAVSESGLVVTDADGRTARFDVAVLATGAPSSPHFDLPGLADIRRQWNWIDDPWDLPLLAKIPRDQAVLIIGSALTMADTVLSLAKQGHCGPIHVLSRHGVVPSARHEQPALPTGISADDCNLPLSQLLHRLRLAVQIHGSEHWQGVFEGLRNCTNALWSGLPPQVQRRFMRHLKGMWDAHRFRMPPSTAQALDRMRMAGQLRFYKGSLQRLEQRSNGSIGVEYRPRGQDSSQMLPVAAIIDCTGPRRPETDWAARLHERMRARGLLAKALCGIGVHATDQGAALNGAGKIVPGLHLIGPPLRGTLLESTAISELRAQADALAPLLMAARPDAQLRGLAR